VTEKVGNSPGRSIDDERDFDDYLEKGLGIIEAEVDAIRTNLLD
jgi:hypothetical protein